MIRLVLLMSILLTANAACGPGSYCASEWLGGANRCSDCPTGYYCPGQSDGSQDCWGEGDSGDNAPKIQCPARTSSPEGADECLLDNPSPIIVSGMCSSQSSYNGFYQAMSKTASDRAYYKNDYGRYIYFDPTCDGSGVSANRWIADSNEPSTTAVNDLDGDGTCSYTGRISSTSMTPPTGTNTWRILCDGSWTDVPITIKSSITLSGSSTGTCYVSGNCFGTGSTSVSSYGCSNAGIDTSTDCYDKCAEYRFNVETCSSSTNNGVSSVGRCSCSGSNSEWEGEFECSSSSATVEPTEPSSNDDNDSGNGNDNDNNNNNDGNSGKCSPFPITDLSENICDQLKGKCGKNFWAEVDMEGGKYQCSGCSRKSIVYVEIPEEEVEEAASADDLSASGPIFGIYAALAIMFKVGSMLVEWATPGKKDKDDSDEPKGLVQKAKALILTSILIKPKKEGEQKTVYDLGEIPYPVSALTCRLWWLKGTGMITEETNKPMTLKYYFHNNHQLTSLFKGDPLIMSTGLRRREFLFGLITTFAISLVFGSGNFGMSIDNSCSYDCLDPNSCRESSSSSTGNDGTGEVSMDWKASLLATICGKLISMGGMQAYIDALHKLRISDGRISKYKSWALSGGIELSWLAILLICQKIEKEATKDSNVDPGTKSSLYMNVAIAAIAAENVSSVGSLIATWFFGVGVWKSLPNVWTGSIEVVSDKRVRSDDSTSSSGGISLGLGKSSSTSPSSQTMDRSGNAAPQKPPPGFCYKLWCPCCAVLTHEGCTFNFWLASFFWWCGFTVCCWTPKTRAGGASSNVERGMSFEDIYGKEEEGTVNVNNVAVLDLRNLSPPQSTKPPPALNPMRSMTPQVVAPPPPQVVAPPPPQVIAPPPPQVIAPPPPQVISPPPPAAIAPPPPPAAIAPPPTPPPPQVPSPWSATYDVGQGQYYYANSETGAVQWEKP
ncbi:hypothetical protein TrVE_jg5244 [Triparma verrucosa]|uniref:WW domain-containing protein n=1 Tax=Triparma verrucosa TaxID=1606542 RepID=A0A9W7BEJ7_9STRA|nr:hypothetical protein TrVE_jg5244 [Triparma verrucosa]